MYFGIIILTTRSKSTANLLGGGRERYVYLLFWRMQRNSNEPFTVTHHEHFTEKHDDPLQVDKTKKNTTWMVLLYPGVSRELENDIMLNP
jgi:hypothetical protein